MLHKLISVACSIFAMLQKFILLLFSALCAGMPAEKMLPFASQVAAAGCRALGARSGLPRRTDPRLAPFLGSFIQN